MNRVAHIRIEEAPDFADLPDGQHVDREARQQRIRAVLMTYCQPKVHGQTAWEISGKILAVLDEVGIEDGAVPLG